MAITLQQLSSETGFSIATISRALNPSTADKVRPATQAIIAQARTKLERARLADTNHTPGKAIGIILASSNKSFSHPFFAEMLDYLQIEIARAGYYVAQVLSESTLSTQDMDQLLSNHPVDGAIILGRILEERITLFKQHIPHLVYTGINHITYDMDEVICNGSEAVATLYNHLRSLDYEKISYIGPLTSESTSKRTYARFATFQTCANAQGNTDYHAQDAQNTTEDGYTAMYRIINSGTLPQAVICASDSAATGAIRAAYENKLVVPNDIAIVGIDNIRGSQYTTPSLTSINVPKADLSRLAVNTLVGKIENPNQIPTKLTLPFDLIIRESCGFRLRHTKA